MLEDINEKTRKEALAALIEIEHEFVRFKKKFVLQHTKIFFLHVWFHTSSNHINY